jgi:hypothetical protein
MGSCLPRHRQVRPDAEAAVRWFHELRRLSAAESERRMGEERRAKFVEGALVTVRVAHTPNTSRTSDAMEADGTSAGSCTGRTIDTDSIVPSPRRTSAGAVRPKGGMVGTDGPGGKRKGARQECLVDVMTINGSRNNHSAASEADAALTLRPAEGAKASFMAEHSVTSLDWLDEPCAICLEPYKENDCVSYSRHQNCAHAFHTSCILTWLKDEFRNDCPCCRGPYLHLCVVEDDVDYLGGKVARPMGATEGVPSRC